MIKIENLFLEYPGRFKLSIERLEIEKESIIAIIGPNGAGKTTFLNIIAMFDVPEFGSVEVFGQNILESRKKLFLRRQMSYVFSQGYLLNDTVYDNISLPLRLRGVKDNTAVEETLGLFQINHLRADNAATLSRGERHRVTLARALVTRPKLLLLDEPFSSLDERYKDSLMQDLRQIIKKCNITAIFVTQNQSEALCLADKMVVMDKGRVLQFAGPQEIFNRPASKKVADFVGVETIIEGVVFKKEENLCFIKAGGNILEAVSECGIGDKVFVCIRPESVTISKQPEIDSARNHFKAVITQIELFGLEYKLILNCGFNLAASVTRQSIENLGLKTGQEVFAVFKATAIHLIKR